jgi:trehalose-6-phosphate synthase
MRRETDVALLSCAALWPLFHYLLWQDVASEYPLEDPNFRPYYEANKAFAKKVAEVHRPGDLIFIHDCAFWSSEWRPLSTPD